MAVIKTGGKQYKVSKNQKLKVEKLIAEKGKEYVFDKVLLVSDDKGKDIKIGDPYVEGAQVKAKVIRQGKAKKIDVVKYKPKVRYLKRYGHRQQFTEVEITDIKQ